jgi:hypothetical protein
MPQLVIDPNSMGTPVRQHSIAQLPPQTRKFGFVPDLTQCEPGDLVLSCSIKPDWIEKQIISTQLNAGFGEDDSRWTHAAVFLYEDFIVEADPKRGVRTRSLYSDIPDSLLRVRRRLGLLPAERYKIALCAQRMLGMRYGFRAALSLGWQVRISEMWDRCWNRRKKIWEEEAAICSQVFHDAHAEITRNRLANCPLAYVMPAHLSATSDLDDIGIPWLQLI